MPMSRLFYLWHNHKLFLYYILTIYNTNPDECEIQANASVVRDMLHMQHMHKVSITKPSLAIDEIALIIENICTK